MRRIRFIAFALVSFVAVSLGTLLAPGTFVNRAFSAALCTLFSFNWTVCTVDLGRNSQPVVAANPPAVVADISDYLQAQRDPSEFGDEPSAPSPQQSNPQAPPFPQDPGPNFPVRREFDDPDTNPVIPSNSQSPSRPNTTGRGQGNLTGEWTFKTQDFKLNYDGSKLTCTPVPNAEMIQPTLLNQNGDKLEMESASHPIVNINFVGEGTISGNQVNLQSDFVTVTGTLSSDGNQIAGKLDCQGVILPFTAIRQRSNQNSCPSTASVPRTYTASSSNNKKRFEAQSNLNEKLLVEIVNPTTTTMHYTDCQGIEFLFRFEKGANSSSIRNLYIGKKSTQKVQIIKIAEAIDPNLEFGCSACDWITEVLKKFDNAKNFDELLNERIQATYKITQSLVKKNFPGAVWESYEQAKATFEDEQLHQDPLEPLKGILKALYDKAMGCNISLASQCAGADAANEIEQETNQPVILTPPNPTNACSEQLTEEERIRKYCTPSGLGRAYSTCFWGTELVAKCPGFYGNPR